MGRKTYSPSFKFKVVLDTINSDLTDAEVARSYDVHPVTVGKWRKKFMENGARIFGQDDALRECKKKVADLERLLGKKEVEIALLKNFLGDS